MYIYIYIYIYVCIYIHTLLVICLFFPGRGVGDPRRAPSVASRARVVPFSVLSASAACTTRHELLRIVRICMAKNAGVNELLDFPLS